MSMSACFTEVLVLALPLNLFRQLGVMEDEVVKWWFCLSCCKRLLAPLRRANLLQQGRLSCGLTFSDRVRLLV